MAPADAGGAEIGADGARSRRSLWILASFVALIAVLGVVSWRLVRDSGGSGAPRAEGGASEEPPKGPERARPAHERVEVPAVKGLSEREARKRLAEAGFEVAVWSQRSPEESTGEVLKQSEASGKRANKGSKVLLTVGEGPGATQKTPKLVGLTYSEADNELKRAGLLLGGVEEVPSETVPAGVIVAQDPLAGTTLEPGSFVYLTTSVGAPGGTTYGY